MTLFLLFIVNKSWINKTTWAIVSSLIERYVVLFLNRSLGYLSNEDGSSTGECLLLETALLLESTCCWRQLFYWRVFADRDGSSTGECLLMEMVLLFECSWTIGVLKKFFYFDKIQITSLSENFKFCIFQKFLIRSFRRMKCQWLFSHLLLSPIPPL